MFELGLFVFLIGLLSALVKVSYELGKDDGWDESSQWADDHLTGTPLRFMTEDEVMERTRPATRDEDA